MKERFRNRLLAALLMTTVGIISLIVTLVAIDLATDDGAAGQADYRYVGGFLLTSNRSELAICVDTIDVDQSVAGAAISSIEEVWPLVEAHRTWAKVASQYTARQRVDPGCPDTPVIVGPRATSEPPSQYRVHVYVAQSNLVYNAPELRNGRLTSEQELCFEDDCLQVTTGLYITPEEMPNIPLMAAYVEQSLGLRPPGPINLPPAEPTSTITPVTSPTAVPGSSPTPAELSATPSGSGQP